MGILPPEHAFCADVRAAFQAFLRSACNSGESVVDPDDITLDVQPPLPQGEDKVPTAEQSANSECSPRLVHVRRCFDLARRSVESGDQPFGAALVLRGKLIAEATNTCTVKRDPTGHAETNLIRDLSSLGLTKCQLAECVFYTSTEPCLMCTGAILHGGVKHVVFGCSQSALVSCISEVRQKKEILCCEELFRRFGGGVRVEGPVLEKEGKQVHADFDWPSFLS